MAQSKIWYLYVDGASRGNPGPSGAGIYLLNQEKKATAKRGYFLGKHTNNEAEYLALLIGVLVAKNHYTPGDQLHIFSDSLLLIKQMRGEFRVKKPELKVLHELVTSRLEGVDCTFTHVFRDFNVEADALANQGVDKKVAVPLSFKSLLHTHGIYV